MSGKTVNPYTPEYYQRLEKGAAQSAQGVWDFLFQHYKPQSILDLGCGSGQWLKEAHKRGVKKLLGLDGHWAQGNFTDLPDIRFVPCDLEKSFPREKLGYDLAMCLEVAEHLSQERATELVKFLCQSADVILFGAAIPNQGGVQHINEQWPRYWETLFVAEGFAIRDCLRPHLWEEPTIEWWYRQNTFIFVHEQRQKDLAQKLLELQIPIINLVHPELLAKKISYIRGMQQAHDAQLKWPDRPFLRKIFSRWLEIKFNRAFSWFKVGKP